jgi:predicted PilT family ATPase
MRDPRTVIAMVREGAAPAHWQVFTKKRGAIGAFFRGTSHDPDPLLVFTSDSVIEYVSEKKPVTAVFFPELATVALRAQATSHSDSTITHLRVWLDLRYGDGRKVKWTSATFASDLRVIQQFLESYGGYKALSGRQ